MSALRFETISEEQRNLLTELSNLDLGALVGGTGLSLQIGHRRSYDLDFVTTKALGEPLLAAVGQKLASYELTQRLQTETQYTAFANNVKITYFQDTAPFKHQIVKDGSIKIANIADIFSTKLFVIGKRATWRDYADIAVCLETNLVTLEQGMSEATERYKVSDRWILDPLTYFDDLEIIPIEWVDKSYSEKEIQTIIVSHVEKYLNKQR